MMGDTYWHDPDLDGDDLARAVWDTVTALVRETRELRQSWAVAVGHYAAAQPASELVSDLGVLEYDFEALQRVEDAPNWNLCRSLPDTIVSHVTFQAPAIKIQTIGAGDITQRAAQQAERFLAASMRDAAAQQAARGALRLATVMGTAWVRTWPDYDARRVRVRCYGPDRVLVDHRAAAHDEPTSQFFIDFVDQAELLAAHAGRSNAAKNAREIIEAETPAYSVTGLRRMIPVIEAVRIMDRETPGRRVVCVRGGVLVDEHYTLRRHRAVAIRYSPGLAGWYGESLVDQIISAQRSLNFAVYSIDSNMRHLSHAYIEDVNAEAQRMADADLPDEVIAPYRVIPAGGRVVTPPIASPQHFAWAEQLWRREHEQHGISQLSATATRPAGVESGEAMRVLHHSQSKRMSELETAYGELWVQMAQRHLDAGDELGAGWQSVVQSGRSSSRVAWDDLDSRPEDYTVTLHPASALSDDPAGRRDEIVGLMRSGLVDRTEARQLAGLADLARSADLAAAQRYGIERVFEGILAGDAVDPPSPMHDLAAAVRLGRAYWALAQRDGGEQDVVDEIERWTPAAQRMLDDASAPSPQSVSGELAADPTAALTLAQAAAVGKA